MVARLTAVLLVCAGWAASGTPAVPDDARTVDHVLNRLAYGPRPGDAARVRAMGVTAWIERQLRPDRIDDAALDARLATLTTLTLDSRTIVEEYDRPAVLARRSGDGSARAPAEAKKRQVLADLEAAKILRAVYSERQLEAVLVDFWFNHFNVYAGKGLTRNYVTEYERDAIRPHVFGHFRDLLGATARSPAMLLYLDNWENVDPGAAARVRSRTARPASSSDKTPPPRGLNENYARELMELHTLGVDGGYSQHDVTEVARAFTGWTMRPRRGTGFVFAAALHDRGTKTVLGHALASGRGIADGEQVLDILAAHPSTARFIATKLVKRFVSDTPPDALVARAAARFRATDGDLREVVRLIVTSPEFFAPPAAGVLTKTPLEFVASALRATSADVQNARPLARALRDLGMPLYRCLPPTGYDGDAERWTSSGALVSRLNFAIALGSNGLPGSRLPPDLNAHSDVAAAIAAPEFQAR